MKENDNEKIFSGLKIKKHSLSDKEKEDMLNTFIQNIQHKDEHALLHKTRSMSILYKLLIAASLIGFISLFSWQLFYTKNYIFPELATITLPDKTIVSLQKGSSLSYYPLRFLIHREVELKGIAYFNVQTKGSFSVNSKHGKVNVLGTKFTVTTTPSFKAQCYQGSVQVVDKQTTQSVILKPFEQVSILNGTLMKSNFAESSPYWLNNRFEFANQTLSCVVSALATNYQLHVIGMELTKGMDFSGSFPTDNIQVACQLVFGPYHLSYKIDGNYLIIFKSE